MIFKKKSLIYVTYISLNLIRANKPYTNSQNARATNDNPLIWLSVYTWNQNITAVIHMTV